MTDIREKDWKIVRSMKDDAYDLACQRIMDKLYKIITTEEKSAHSRYLELWKTLKAEDENIALMFDNMKRSSALHQLARWRFADLITDSDLESFSPGTLKVVNAFIEVWR